MRCASSGHSSFRDVASCRLRPLLTAPVTWTKQRTPYRVPENGGSRTYCSHGDPGSRRYSFPAESQQDYSGSFMRSSSTGAIQ
jgi:hypothetical protein